MLPLELARRVAPYLIALGLVFAALFGAYRHGVNTTTTEWQAKWNAQAAEMAVARAHAERIQRDEEQRRQFEIERVRNDARKQIQQAAADAAAATAAADGLRQQAQRLAARASEGCGNPGLTIRSKAAATAGVVLANVLARADEAAGELAAAYDRARAAGAACERAYDAVSMGAQ